MVMAQNVHEQTEMGKIAEAVGADRTSDPVVTPGNDGGTGALVCRLSDRGLKDYYSLLRDSEREQLEDARWQAGELLCGAGIWNCAINARGEVSERSEAGWEHYQRHLLEEEAIEFDPAGRVDLVRYRWEPPRRAPRSR